MKRIFSLFAIMLAFSFAGSLAFAQSADDFDVEGFDFQAILSSDNPKAALEEQLGIEISEDDINKVLEGTDYTYSDADGLKDSSGQSATWTDALQDYAEVNNINTSEILDQMGFGDALKGVKEQIDPIVDGLNGAFDAAAATFVDVVPNLATMVNIYPDAYIGQLIGLPPHFALGSSTSATMMDISFVPELLKAFGAEEADLASIPSKLALPTFTADVRLGGIVLPFDLGLGINILNNGMKDFVFDKVGEAVGDAEIANYKTLLDVDFVTVNVDFRYCLLKQTVLLPNISVGGGFTHLHGGLGLGIDDLAAVRFKYQTNIIYLDAQVSKKILFLTPFAGLKLSTDFTKVDWSWGLEGELGDMIAAYNELVGAENSINVVNSGSAKNSFRVLPQVYGGFALNLFVIKLNTVIGYDFVTGLPSATLSMRIQI